MSWSYSGSPGSSDLDECRFYLQDTDPALQLLQDEEIQFLLTSWDGVDGIAIHTASICADILAARFAKEISVSADGVSVSTSELMDRFTKLGTNLRATYAKRFEAAGPDLSSLIPGYDWDPTIKPLNFGVGFMDNYEAGQQAYGEYSPGDGNPQYGPDWSY